MCYPGTFTFIPKMPEITCSGRKIVAIEAKAFIGSFRPVDFSSRTL
jgi:hypothetical protein